MVSALSRSMNRCIVSVACRREARLYLSPDSADNYNAPRVAYHEHTLSNSLVDRLTVFVLVDDGENIK